MNGFSFAAGYISIASLFLLFPCRADDAPPRMVGVNELVERILANDPELLALRGEVRNAQANEREMDARRDPELRLGYNRSGDRAVPRPYTETLSETVYERSRLSDQRAATSSRSGGERRVDSSGIENRDFSASRNIQQTQERTRNETSRSTTIREITPTRNGEHIHEIYTEMRESGTFESGREQESYQEFQRQQNAIGTNLLSVNGTLSGNDRQNIHSREVISRETFTERHYGYDPYEGGDQYSVELRFYPRNPWEIRKLVRAAQARVSLSEQRLLARMHEREMEVRKVWLELYLLKKETNIMADRLALFQEDLEYQSRRHEAGVAGPEVLSRSQSGLFDARLSLHEAKRRVEEGVEELAFEGDLNATEAVDIDTPPHVPELVLEGLDRRVLTDSAVENSPDLASLIAQSHVAASTLEARRATRIPWLSVISATYDYEERYGGKYRDEYGVMAAFTLPVFSWLDKDLGAGEKADLANLRKQRDLLVRRIEIKLRRALNALERAQEDRLTLLRQGLELRDQLQTQLEKMDTQEPAFQEAQLRMRRTLLDTHRLELHVERNYARALLELEAVLGMSLNSVFKREPVRTDGQK